MKYPIMLIKHKEPSPVLVPLNSIFHPIVINLPLKGNCFPKNLPRSNPEGDYAFKGLALPSSL